MAFDINDRPQTIEEMRAYVSGAAAAAVRARLSLGANGPNLAETISGYYNLAGVSDSEANVKGSEILREAQKIETALTGIIASLAAILRKTDATISAHNDHETKQRAARAKLG